MALMLTGHTLFLALMMFAVFTFEESVSNYSDWVTFMENLDQYDKEKLGIACLESYKNCVPEPDLKPCQITSYGSCLDIQKLHSAYWAQLNST